MLTKRSRPLNARLLKRSRRLPTTSPSWRSRRRTRRFWGQPAELEAITEEEPIEERIHPLDWQTLLAHGFVSDVSRDSALNSSYRAIARPVLANAFPDSSVRLQRGNLVLVTSSRFGEGKTFTAVNLALSIVIEEPERKVLLIDADTEKSGLTKFFALSDRAGLAELLENKGRHWQDTVLRMDLPGLWILPSGSLKPKSHSLLGGAEMMKFAKELSRLHADHLVIFDAPPLLEVAETASLAMQVGQVLLVVEAEMTPQVVVREAVAKLEYCNVVGCILNKTAEHRVSGDLSSGYGLYSPDNGDR